MIKFHCLGLNHHTASVSLREQIAFDEERIRDVLELLGTKDNGKNACAAEMVILSTCNRVEIYTAASGLEIGTLKSNLAKIHGLEAELFDSNLYHYEDEQVVDHLFRVAAGLDSLVPGEPQILGQVSDALILAQSEGTAGPVLTRLFQSAATAGKRARSETGISRNPGSVASVAAGLAEKSVQDFTQARLLVIGGGQMAELAVEALRKRGAGDILVINRTRQRASELAGRWNARSATFEELEHALLQADIVISSTGAPHTLIHSYMVAEIMSARQNRPLVMIDIAVPRDIDPEAAYLPGVRLFDMDTLQERYANSLACRLNEVPKVEAILNEERLRFMEYLKTLEVVPLIADLHQQIEAIRQNELEKSFNKLPDLNEAERESIEAMSRALIKRILDAPIMRLRAEADCPYGSEYAAVARTLFGLAEGPVYCNFASGPCERKNGSKKVTIGQKKTCT